jgi:hypothetical protein
MSLFRGTLRLSLVVALLVAVWVMIENYQSYSEQLAGRENIMWSLRCGAKLNKVLLESVKSEFGTYDIGKLGCADKQFWASDEEMQQAWSGDEAKDWTNSAPTFDYLEVVVKSVFAFLLINLCGLLFWISRKTLSWIKNGYA